MDYPPTPHFYLSFLLKLCATTLNFDHLRPVLILLEPNLGVHHTYMYMCIILYMCIVYMYVHV
jgi:hypothetical protein